MSPEVVGQLRRVEDVDQLCLQDLRIVDEVGQLLLQKVDALVERNDYRDVGGFAGCSVLYDVLNLDRSLEPGPVAGLWLERRDWT